MNFNLNTLLFYATTALVVLSIGLTVLIALHLRRISKSPSHIPWVGLKGRRIFPKLRACLSELTAGRSMIDEGYEKYSKNGLPFILPGMHWNAVVLPPSNAAWMAQQPDSILSGTTTMDDLTGIHYIVHSPSAESARDFTVIRRDLSRQIMKLSHQVYDEIQAAFDDELKDVGDEWTDVKMQKVIMQVSFRAANRIFVGLPLCRSKAYQKAVERWTVSFGLGVMMVRYLVPETLRSLVWRVTAIPTRFMEWWTSRCFIGQVKERLAKIETGKGEKENDMMQWIIDQNATKGDSRELHPRSIAGKMILFNIFATATTGIQSGNILMELLSSHLASSVLPQLQTEASDIMPQIVKDPRQIREMSKLDSLIRETLRYHPMTPQGLVREVVKPGGITTPDGVYLPQGTHVHSIVRNMHRDKDIFGEDADSFDPLRYYNSPSPVPFAVQASQDFLPWGLGRHACPGRFFAVHVMKLMLGHLLMKFDLEPLEEKAKFLTLGDSEYPSDTFVVKMRRRKAGHSTR